MRSRIAGAIAAIASLSVGVPPAAACAAFPYQDAVAEARVLGTDGRWRIVHIEVSGPLMRIEYESSRSASGRTAIVFDVEGDRALVFPAKGPWTPPLQARVGFVTTLEAALAPLGLRPFVLGRYRAAWAPTERVGDFVCQGAIGNWGYNGKYDSAVCVLSTRQTEGVGLPVYAKDRAGRRVFELTRVTPRAIDKAQFAVPSDFRLETPGPRAFKDRKTCSG